MAKQITVIQGHPAEQSFCGSLATEYAQGAVEAGHVVRTIVVRDLAFDPILHEGYRVVQPLEPDLVRAQDDIKAADHVVMIYPIWWGGMPALLKGFIDRVLLPGFAFKYRQGSPWWDKYLTGKTGHILATMDTPPWYFRIVYRDAGINQMRRAILEYCGIKPVRVTRIGRVKDAPDAWKRAWLSKARGFGRHA